MKQLSWFIVFFVCFLTTTVVACMAGEDEPSASILFRQLLDPATTDQASQRLRRLCEKDSDSRAFVAAHLPPFLAAGPGPEERERPWFNALRLAGELKLVEAAPALAKWIGLNNGTGVVGLSRDERLEDNPVARTLAEMGDPAIPTLNAVFKHPDKNDRLLAARALTLIGSPAARDALTAQLDRESDADLRGYMRKVLKGWKPDS